MVCLCKECRCISFITIMLVSIYLVRFIQILALRKSLGWKIRKYLPPLTVLLFRNSTNFVKVKTSEINQNVLIRKISLCEKTSKFPKQIKEETNYQKNNKFLLKKLQLFYIFQTNVSKSKYIKCWSIKKTLCTYFYVDPTRHQTYDFKHIASII